MELDPRLRGDDDDDTTDKAQLGDDNADTASRSYSDSPPPPPQNLEEALAAGYSTLRSPTGNVDVDGSITAHGKGVPIANTAASSDKTHNQGQKPDDGPNDEETKRSRACEACRGLKVRCEPDPDDGPCKRCKKAGRKCIVTMPTRKPPERKTDSRVGRIGKED